jgi:death on curing protein
VSRYLTFAEIVEINAEMVKQFGGIHGLRDAGALHAAVARPQNGYYMDSIEEAAALFESLAQNHPFLDGNKRTAITATGVFLLLNNMKLGFHDLEAYQWLIGLYETGRVNKVAIESWLRQHVRPLR